MNNSVEDAHQREQTSAKTHVDDGTSVSSWRIVRPPFYLRPDEDTVIFVEQAERSDGDRQACQLVRKGAAQRRYDRPPN